MFGDVSKHAPYMHDGSLKTLENVVDYYDKGGTPNPQLTDNSDKTTQGESTDQEWPIPTDKLRRKLADRVTNVSLTVTLTIKVITISVGGA